MGGYVCFFVAAALELKPAFERARPKGSPFSTADALADFESIDVTMDSRGPSTIAAVASVMGIAKKKPYRDVSGLPIHDEMSVHQVDAAVLEALARLEGEPLESAVTRWIDDTTKREAEAMRNPMARLMAQGRVYDATRVGPLLRDLVRLARLAKERGKSLYQYVEV